MWKRTKTVLLLGIMTGILLGIGSFFEGGLYIALGFAVLMNGAAYFFSDKIAIKMARAQPMSRDEYPDVHEMVERLSRQAGEPAPRLYISPSPQLNAFATGRNPKNGVVCVNRGLYEALSRDELEGVIGHELQHVYNRDILVSSVAAILGAAIIVLARMAFWFGRGNRNMGMVGALAMVILAPIAAMIIQATISRTRESLADRTGAELTGNPLALANALRKLETGNRDPRRQRMGASPAETNEAFQHMYITAPFGGRIHGGLSKLFSSHPDTGQRIAQLEEMARKQGQIGPDYRGR
jgi:heat shock protein HtpX